MSTDPFRERVLAIVTLIAQYVLEERDFQSEGEMVEELLAEGFGQEEIEAAFSWMENTALPSEPPFNWTPEVKTHRVFTPQETSRLSGESLGLLMRLRIMGILDDQMHEEIVERAMGGVDDEIGLQDLKPLVALTIFTRTYQAWQREITCLIEEDWLRLFH
jgi:Smg protein